MNVANRITISRLFFIPVFILFVHPDFLQLISISKETGAYIAFTLFLLAALTDRLDGYVARKYNQVTRLGMLLDPLVDKILVASALIMLVSNDLAPSWIAIVIIYREFMVTLLRIMASKKGFILAADGYGKIKMVLQVTAIALLLYPNAFYSMYGLISIGELVLFAAAGLTIYSGIKYMLNNRAVYLHP